MFSFSARLIRKIVESPDRMENTVSLDLIVEDLYLTMYKLVKFAFEVVVGTTRRSGFILEGIS